MFWPADWLEAGMATIDSTGCVLEINEALANWLEKSPAELKGISFWETIAALIPQWKPQLAEMH